MLQIMREKQSELLKC